MKNFLIKLIRLYQATPLKCHNNCRCIPTCSNYMIDALNYYGTIKGLKLGIKRILRCNPLGTSGYDPLIKEK